MQTPVKAQVFPLGTQISVKLTPLFCFRCKLVFKVTLLIDSFTLSSNIYHVLTVCQGIDNNGENVMLRGKTF